MTGAGALPARRGTASALVSSFTVDDLRRFSYLTGAVWIVLIAAYAIRLVRIHRRVHAMR